MARVARNSVSTTVFLVLWLMVCSNSVLALDTDRLLTDSLAAGDFQLAAGNDLAVLLIDSDAIKGVTRAAGDLQADIVRVTGKKPEVVNEAGSHKYAVIIGTVGTGRLVDSLIAADKLDVSEIKGKWESYIIQTVANPLPGIENGLVIAGSDKRGTIYGIYTISEQIGVSPWYWWADVPVKKAENLYVKAGRYVYGEPAVKYRGIFLNDEAPALSGWSKEKFGGFNSKFYVHVFELLLRLKANFLWPAMWGSAFNSDDPLNPVLAHEYGIVMSTSHHEPMMRAQSDWNSNRSQGHSWDYTKSESVLQEFWRGGLQKVKDYDKVITLAMRGDGDEPMTEGQNVALLEKIVADQRKIIAEVINPDVTKVPQVWALYKEVQGYYERGMRVPDDVTLLWCDDNWGNIRRLPAAEEKERSGGAGVYYHFDYVGGPRSYRWINTNAIPKVWEQMNLAYEYGARQLWVVNVGDLKPMEYPIEFFLTYAIDPTKWRKESLGDYTRKWVTREFGQTYAEDIAIIIEKYTRLNSRIKPEVMTVDTYSLVNYREAERVLEDYAAIVAKAEEIHAALPAESKDAFFQLVLHPAKAAGIVAEMYVKAGLNRMYVAQGRIDANAMAARVKELFQADIDLAKEYHSLGGGKWNHMMDQTHIGYTSWDNPRRNIMPAVTEVTPVAQAQMGVAVEGETQGYPEDDANATLPVFESYARQKYYIEIFNRGTGVFDFTTSTDMNWITLSQTKGRVDSSIRLWVTLNWADVPAGDSKGEIIISGTDLWVPVQVKAFKPDLSAAKENCFLESDGCVSIEPENFTANVPATECRWEKIPGYGISQSAMSVFPVNAGSVEVGKGPRLEYDIYLFNAGTVEFLAFVSPSLNFDPDRGVSLAVSVDDQSPQVVEFIPKGYNAGEGNLDWESTVKQNARLVKASLEVKETGNHTLKVWMVDPGVVLQKIVLNTGSLRNTHFGPWQSPYFQSAMLSE